MNEITIYTQAQPLAVKEYQGERVITFKDIDTLHQRPEGTARRNFSANRGRFIEGEDYFVRNSYEAKEEFGATAPNGLTLLTKMGYLMLVKSFTDDLAWMVQRQLVRSYFEAQAVTPPPSVQMLAEREKSLPRMRTIPKAAAEIRQQDPSTHLTVTVLRRMVKAGVIPTVQVGERPLINLDTLERFMEGEHGKH